MGFSCDLSNDVTDNKANCHCQWYQYDLGHTCFPEKQSQGGNLSVLDKYY